MNRPSLYGAFGDKHRLYLSTLDRYREFGRSAMKEELSPDRPLEEGLRAVFARAISIYMAGYHGARGCYLIGTRIGQFAMKAGVDVQTLRFYEREGLLAPSSTSCDPVIPPSSRIGPPSPTPDDRMLPTPIDPFATRRRQPEKSVSLTCPGHKGKKGTDA